MGVMTRISQKLSFDHQRLCQLTGMWHVLSNNKMLQNRNFTAAPCLLNFPGRETKNLAIDETFWLQSEHKSSFQPESKKLKALKKGRSVQYI